MENIAHNDLTGPAESAIHRMPPQASVRRGLLLVALQFAALVGVSLLIAWLDLDRAVASLFYQTDTGGFLARSGPWRWLYRFGTLPGAMLALVCLGTWLVTFFKPRLSGWRPYLLLVVLTTVIAGGILVNGILKSYWGRPRPNQTTEFGGFYTYRHVFPPGTPGKGSSFPCGHCTMGFCMLSLYYARRRSKVLAYAGTASGIVMGTLLSIARIINGAHFLSDAIWSLGIVSMTAAALYYCVLKIPARRPEERPSGLSRGRRMGLTAAVAAAALLLVGGVMTRRPFFKTTEYYPNVTADTRRLVIELNTDPEKLMISNRARDGIAVLLHAHGFGWAYVDYEIDYAYQRDGDTLILRIRIDPRSYFAELNHSVEVVAPEALQKGLEILVNPDQPVPDP